MEQNESSRTEIRKSGINYGIVLSALCVAAFAGYVGIDALMDPIQGPVATTVVAASAFSFVALCAGLIAVEINNARN